MVQPQHGTSTKRVKRTLPVLLLHGASTKRGAMVQPQHGMSTKQVKRTLPVLTVARREYKTRCNATARHEYKTGKTYITRADCAIVYARHEYKKKKKTGKKYKHDTHCARVQPQHGTSTMYHTHSIDHRGCQLPSQSAVHTGKRTIAPLQVKYKQLAQIQRT